MSKSKKMPAEVLIYVCDYDDNGGPIFGVAKNVDDIPLECDDTKVGNYTLNRVSTFKIRYELWHNRR